MIRVLLVDDQRLVRRAISARLNAIDGIEVAAEAASGEQARTLSQQHDFDIVLMDLNMPGIGGLEATRRVIAQKPETRVIGLSMYVSGPFPKQFLRCGGAGYVSKNADLDELVEAIRKVHGGDSYISADVAQNLVAADAQRGPRHGIEALSRREIQVLQQIANGYGLDEIATRLSLSRKTVQHHRRHLLTKLDARNDVQLATIAREHGIADAETLTG